APKSDSDKSETVRPSQKDGKEPGGRDAPMEDRNHPPESNPPEDSRKDGTAGAHNTGGSNDTTGGPTGTSGGGVPGGNKGDLSTTAAKQP
ncbi:hypothetical protein PFISCL1PPCAC_8505, partial [Pristionchus fissidentatus]